MTEFHPPFEPGNIYHGPVVPSEVIDLVRMRIGSILAGVMTTLARRPSKRTSLDTERLSSVGCDAVAKARFYDRRVF